MRTAGNCSASAIATGSRVSDFGRILDECRKPRRRAPRRDITQVGPNPIADPDRMTGGAYLLEKRLAGLGTHGKAGIAA